MVFGFLSLRCLWWAIWVYMGIYGNIWELLYFVQIDCIVDLFLFLPPTTTHQNCKLWWRGQPLSVHHFKGSGLRSPIIMAIIHSVCDMPAQLQNNFAPRKFMPISPSLLFCLYLFISRCFLPSTFFHIPSYAVIAKI